MNTLKIYIFLTGYESRVIRRCERHEVSKTLTKAMAEDKNGCWQLENLLRNNWQCTQANTNCCRIASRRGEQELQELQETLEMGQEQQCWRYKPCNSNKRQQTTQLTQQFRWVCENLLFLSSPRSLSPSLLLLTDSFYVGNQNLFTPNPKLCSTMGFGIGTW